MNTSKVKLRGVKSNKKNQLASLELRREQVADLYVKGKSQCAIAQQLGVSQATISNDLVAIRQQWLESTIRDFDTAKSVELAKLEKIEAAAWTAYERSLEDVETTRSRTEQSPRATSANGHSARGLVTSRQISESTRKQQLGDVRYLETITRCVEMRLKVLGALKPQQTNVIQAMQLQWDAIGTDTAPGSTGQQLDDLAVLALSGDEIPTNNQPINGGNVNG